jgi:uncharacterized membrane protein HdeD (DUF308 family)
MNTIEKQMAAVLARRWWLLLLRGLVAIAFGVLITLQPAITLKVLVLLFGIYVLVDGILGVWLAISGRGWLERGWVLLLWGLVGIGVGILTFLRPNITALALLFYIAIWAVAAGVLEIAAAIRLRKEMKGEWILILGGLATVAFGVLLMAWPTEGALAVLWLIATYGISFGVLLVILAIRARSFGRQLERL